MTRPQVIFLPIIALGFLILAVLTRQLTCSDPAGCSWFKPGASVFIGLNRIASGPDRLRSLQVAQGANQAVLKMQALEGHPLEVLPVDTNCLPGSSNSSASGLAGTRQISAVSGPVCSQDQAVFQQAIQAAGKVLLAPIPKIDAGLFAARASALFLKRNRGSHPYVLGLAEDSIEIAALFCQELAKSGLGCANPETGAAEGSSQAPPDAFVLVSLEDVVTDLNGLPEELSGLPVTILSLSRPYLPEVAFSYDWIGPEIWDQPGPYLSSSEIDPSMPPSIAGMAAFEGVRLVRAALEKSRQKFWDGSWLLPHQAFSQQIAEESQASIFLKTSANQNEPNGEFLTLTIFQVNRIEYNNLNP